MCKKSKFPLVFNIFLAFFITLVVTIFVKAGEGALTPESFIIGMIQGFCLNMTLETIIDLPAMGNKFVRALGVKKMEGPAAYFLRLLAIVFVIVLLMSFLLMFCEIGFAMGAGFFGFWITKVPAIFVCIHHRRHRLHPLHEGDCRHLFQGGLNRMTQEDVYKPSCRRKDLFDRR
ncbi:MAG: hypothetical protein ACLUES_06535 [Flavonifractor plautii]